MLLVLGLLMLVFWPFQRLLPPPDLGITRMPSPSALEAAQAAIDRAGWQPGDHRTLTLIDFSLHSSQKRLWVINLETGEVLMNDYVAHGMNTGDGWATEFSNEEGSRQSSLGLFVARGTYTGQHGYSLRLDGLEPGINNHARKRHIVIHGADYVSRDAIRKWGRLGRSWGCPAVPQAINRKLIDTIKWGGWVYAYHGTRSLQQVQDVDSTSSP
jgi:hypothetical protein